MKDPHLVLKRILRTEKGSGLTARNNQYCFEVEREANKIEIKHAIEEVYKVKVRKVNTHILHGKPKTLRMARGWRPDWKKAVVTLDKGQKIELAE